ncbi:ABC transporter permease subunit [Hymenobacter mucosus]|uniref:ABC-2 type transport system permease protein n=1 Tax=Hymenobacter mucosus TaxID=1411120 RepID=A0A239AF91_9BACT|nr:ABC transporter permease subunit [Hymenobacter mucosus]SNR93688.1 ABC-2 type transport system permease protein [Hymenobacter mucosus]
MIQLLLKKELTELLRTTKVTWLLVGLAALLGLALYNGYAYSTTRSQFLRESQHITYQQFISQGDKNPHLGAHFGFYAYKPTADLALVDNGLEDYTGNSFYLEPHQRGVVKFREVSDATGLRSFGFLNAGYFAQFILPLFIFLLTHNVFAKEWENGTIKMVLSTRVQARQLFTGKLLACGLVVGAVVATLALGALGLLLVQRGAAGLGPVLLTYGCYVVGLTMYAVLLTVLGVAVSLLARSSALALVVLAGFWLVGVFLVPRLAGELSRQVYPSITAVEFDDQTFREKEYGMGNEGTKDHRRALLEQRTLAKYHVKRLEDLPVFYIPITIEYFEETDGLVMDRAYAAVERNEARQNAFVLTSAVLSPFLAFRDFSLHLTATDINTHNDFAQQAEAHRRRVGRVVDAFYQKHTVASNDFWKTVPQFAYSAPGLGWRLHNAVAPLVILLVWLVAAGGMAVWAYRRLTA